MRHAARAQPPAARPRPRRLSLTRRGWSLVVAAAALWLGGLVFGLMELYMLSAACIAAMAGAAATTFLAGLGATASRRVEPARLPAGRPITSVVTVEAGARLPAAPLWLVEQPPLAAPVDRSATLVCPRRQQSAVVTRELTGLPRGVYEIPPVTLVSRDALGLFETALTLGEASTVVVYPATRSVRPIGAAAGAHEPLEGLGGPSPGGDEFHTLRPYSAGDDLRRVHWPTVARTGELMVRQDAVQRDLTLSVALDLRSAVHDGWSVEAVIAASASILASTAIVSSVRLVTTAGGDSGRVAGPGGIDALLDQLARAGAGRGAPIDEVAAGTARSHDGGALIVVTTSSCPSAELEALPLLRPPRMSVLVRAELAAAAPPGIRPGMRPTTSNAPGGQRREGAPRCDLEVAFSADVPFERAWSETLGRFGLRPRTMSRRAGWAKSG